MLMPPCPNSESAAFASHGGGQLYRIFCGVDPVDEAWKWLGGFGQRVYLLFFTLKTERALPCVLKLEESEALAFTFIHSNAPAMPRLILLPVQMYNTRKQQHVIETLRSCLLTQDELINGCNMRPKRENRPPSGRQGPGYPIALKNHISFR